MQVLHLDEQLLMQQCLSLIAVGPKNYNEHLRVESFLSWCDCSRQKQYKSNYLFFVLTEINFNDKIKKKR